jgi:hypothetical protein
VSFLFLFKYILFLRAANIPRYLDFYLGRFSCPNRAHRGLTGGLSLAQFRENRGFPELHSLLSIYLMLNNASNTCSLGIPKGLSLVALPRHSVIPSLKCKPDSLSKFLQGFLLLEFSAHSPDIWSIPASGDFSPSIRLEFGLDFNFAGCIGNTVLNLFIFKRKASPAKRHGRQRRLAAALRL